MTKILSNCHTHSLYCDGRDPIRSMVDAALSLGFQSIGFSGHGLQLFDDYAMTPEGCEAYRRDIADLKRELDGRIRIWAGVERDYFSCDEPERYEYYIANTSLSGSVTPEAICEALENADKVVFNAVNEVYKEFMGTYIHAESDVSAADVLTLLVKKYCIETPVFDRIYILFTIR